MLDTRTTTPLVRRRSSSGNASFQLSGGNGGRTQTLLHLMGFLSEIEACKMKTLKELLPKDIKNSVGEYLNYLIGN